MRRRDLRRFAQVLRQEAECKPVEYWLQQEYPSTYISSFEGNEVQVEISLLEKTDEFIQLGIALSDSGWICQFVPVGICAVVRTIRESGT